jgi:transcription initiation factor TFIIB
MSEDQKTSECSEKIYDYSRGTVVCVDNGIVIEERLVDQGPYWRAYTPEEREVKIQSGTPSQLPEDSLIETTFMTSRSDFNLSEYAKVPIAKVREFSRLKRWNERIKIEAGSRTYINTQKIIANAAKKLGIPEYVVIDAKKILKNAIKEGIYRHGYPLAAIAVACLLYAARKNKIYLSLYDVEKITLTRRDFVLMKRFYRKLVEEYGRVWSDVDQIISSSCSKLSLPQDVEETAKEIYRMSLETGASSGKSPYIIAAACIYIAVRIHDIPISQRELALALSVSEASIRGRAMDILKKMGLKVEKLDDGIEELKKKIGGKLKKVVLIE